MTISALLAATEQSITKQKEREYFWIHEARYKKILERLSMIPGILGSKSEDSGNRSRVGNKSEYSGNRSRALDVGCFPYHLGFAMERMGLDVYGISSQHEPIRSEKIKVCNIETDKFPFKDNYFDAIIFTEVLEHLPQSPLFALRQMYRVLKPGGSLILTTPNVARSINRAKLLLGKSVGYPLHQIIEDDGKGSNIYHRHNREYTLDECIDITRLANFSVVTGETFVSYTPSRRRIIPDPLWLKAGKTVNYALMLMIAGLRDTILIVGKK